MTSVVTGAFGYIGKHIARRLCDLEEEVRTVTTHPDKPNPFGEAVRAFPYDFNWPERLTEHLRGASTLYNTYWIRFEYGGATFQQAVQNTATLFDCARQAGIQKIVQISVTNASATSDLPYYAGKAHQESALIDSGVPYSIVRPTLVFGAGDILVNNIAWLIRRFPVFPIFGTGAYRLQPVHIDDLATIAIEAAKDPRSAVMDAIGPEEYTFRDLVQLIAANIKPNLKLFRISPSIGLVLGRMVGLTVGDIILTRDELRGLMDELLTSEQAPNGTTPFSDWLQLNRDEVGTHYASELKRHFKWAQT